jgi:DNA-binding Xre family transcriptional regulator
MVSRIFDPRGTIDRVLSQIQAEGGPDLDLSALAQEAGVSIEWLYDLDQGQLGLVHLGELERICRILGRSPNDLLGYEADE